MHRLWLWIKYPFRFEDDKRVLKDRLRKAKESERKLEREKKRAEGERERQGRKIKEMEEIIKAKNLAEKFDWRQKCAEAEERAQAAERALADGEKNAALKTQSMARTFMIFEFNSGQFFFYNSEFLRILFQQ